MKKTTACAFGHCKYQMVLPVMEMLCLFFFHYWVDFSETWKKVEGDNLKHPLYFDENCTWNFNLKKLLGLKTLLDTIMCNVCMCLFVSRSRIRLLDRLQRIWAEGSGHQPSESSKWNAWVLECAIPLFLTFIHTKMFLLFLLDFFLGLQ